jgi:hypothetical protein
LKIAETVMSVFDNQENESEIYLIPVCVIDDMQVPAVCISILTMSE